MSTSMKKFAAGAATYINRAVQFTEEKLGSAEKTELDAQFENLQERADKTKAWTEKIVRQTEVLLQPNPTVRLEEFVYVKLDKKKPDSMTECEYLGQYMTDAGNDFGPGTSYGSALVKVGCAQRKLGQAQREFMQKSVENFLKPLHNFLEGDMKTLNKERRLLLSKRLDLDVCKTKARKAKSQTSTAQAESDVRTAQAEFDRQTEITQLLLESIISTHTTHQRALSAFVEAQTQYFSQCQEYMQELQRDIGSFSLPSTPAGGGDHNSYNSHTSNPPLRPSAPPMIKVTDVTPIVKQQARVLYDYDAANQNELTLLADEYITVYQQPGLDEDWMMAERGPYKGKVPVTYLEIIH